MSSLEFLVVFGRICERSAAIGRNSSTIADVCRAFSYVFFGFAPAVNSSSPRFYQSLRIEQQKGEVLASIPPISIPRLTAAW
jgi:hypothetical protein